MKIEDILKLPAEEAIAKLKERTTALPSAEMLLKEWDPFQHDVMNKEIRKDKKKIKTEAVYDESGKEIKPAEYELDPVNRIPLPLEQDQVNIHTAFTVGLPPKLTCDSEEAEDKEVFAIVKLIERGNKLKFQNKAIVRSFLSEIEVAEYWYTVEDDKFWKKAGRKVGKSLNAKNRLKCAIWSPLRGDKLYPLFDEKGDMVALSREYRVKENDSYVNYFFTITKENTYLWKESTGEPVVKKHGFKKIPCIYTYRKAGTLCKNIKPVRERLENLFSNYADCIDYNFFPKLIIEGDLDGSQKRGAGNMVKLEEGGKAYYLTWSQTPESVRMEFDTLLEQAYSLTKTPRISFENLKGMGQTSGVAFEFAFMGIHAEVQNHAEDIESFLQRRYNFLVSAIGSICVEYDKAITDIEPEITPYMINDLAARINAAVAEIGRAHV